MKNLINFPVLRSSVNHPDEGLVFKASQSFPGHLDSSFIPGSEVQLANESEKNERKKLDDLYLNFENKVFGYHLKPKEEEPIITS